ncbi:MAG: nitroreductase [Candidatus Kerfeldbacteria bacterium CG_4_10_14_0_8_um_filter_42_10]|uniref:Nitroreductase n=1 Tax=Candidatus Kerfeldbacteria bacterium CG_4_10_14_0_8_um_filter_42_10 TaxID=2014248 RepID=A0A2M7RHG3_9BACT|nr:MAG: nitroreductase [Candidatus Kerfeldbacteria bacterium CG_4_10_14_0_8_um_filter_42_10]
MEFKKTIELRHSVRHFLKQPIKNEKINSILDVVNNCPSAGNLQSYKIYLIKKQDVKKELAAAALDQEFIAQAPIVMVFCAKQEECAAKYGARGKNLYSLQDATIAASYAQLAAADLNIGTVWVGAFDSEKVKSVLRTSYLPVAIIPMGYYSEKSFLRERKQKSQIVEEI